MVILGYVFWRNFDMLVLFIKLLIDTKLSLICKGFSRFRSNGFTAIWTTFLNMSRAICEINIDSFCFLKVKLLVFDLMSLVWLCRKFRTAWKRARKNAEVRHQTKLDSSSSSGKADHRTTSILRSFVPRGYNSIVVYTPNCVIFVFNLPLRSWYKIFAYFQSISAPLKWTWRGNIHGHGLVVR